MVFFTLGCLLIAQPSIGQKQRTFEVSLVDYAQELEAPAFTLDKVFDDRRNKSNLGIIERGISGKVFTVLDGTFDETVAAFLHETVPSKEGEIPIVIKVASLELSNANRGLKELCRAEVELKYYRQNEDKRWQLLYQNLGTHYEECWDEYTIHSENLSKALHTAISEFDILLKESAETGTSTESLVEHKAPSAYPIYSDANYQEGVFLTLDEFQTNQPSECTPFEYKIKGEKIRLWTLDEKGKKQDLSKVPCVGFALDGRLFLQFLERFYEVEKSEDGFVFYGPTEMDVGAQFEGWFYFGLLGATMASAVSEVTTRYEMDINTGKISRVR